MVCVKICRWLELSWQWNQINDPTDNNDSNSSIDRCKLISTSPSCNENGNDNIINVSNIWERFTQPETICFDKNECEDDKIDILDTLCEWV